MKPASVKYAVPASETQTPSLDHVTNLYWRSSFELTTISRALPSSLIR